MLKRRHTPKYKIFRNMEIMRSVLILFSIKWPTAFLEILRCLLRNSETGFIKDKIQIEKLNSTCENGVKFPYRWLNARLKYYLCVSNGVTAVLR